MRSRLKAWVAVGLFAAAVLALGVYFAVAGLSTAGQVAGIVSAFIGLGGLALTAYATLGAHPDPAPPPGVPEHGPGGSTVTNMVKGSTVVGPVIQTGQLHGGVRPDSSRRDSAS